MNLNLNPKQYGKLNSKEIRLDYDARECATRFKKAHSDLLFVLQKVDQIKLFRKLGYGSLWDYTVKRLGISESMAYPLIQVSRKCSEIPELGEAISEGKVSISHARKIVPILKKENQEKWIKKASRSSLRDLEKALAKSHPKATRSEKICFVGKDQVLIETLFTEAEFELLKRIQDLESTRQKKPVKLNEAIVESAKVYLKKNDPIEKAKRAKNRQERMNQDFKKHDKNILDSSLNSKNKKLIRTSIPTRVKHRVIQRDHSRCQFRSPNGEKCESKRHLEVHHIRPLSQNGTHEMSNLVLLCSTHHRFVHS